jgi:hypothetical protein
LFESPIIESMPCEKTYDVDRYLSLLSSYSQYIGLDSPIRESLFARLREVINQQLNGEIQLFNLAAFQIAKKL